MNNDYNWMIGLFLAILLLSCSSKQPAAAQLEALPYYDEATFTPHWHQPGSDVLTNFHRIPRFNLRNQEGDSITEKTFAGKIYVTDFFFTSCPGICPKMTENMAVLQEEFLDDDDILLLSHSVTPKHDSVPTLKFYADKKGVISGKWHLATGDRKEIYNLGRQAYFVEEDQGLEKDPDEFLHTENFVLIDQERHIRGIYNGLDRSSVAQLISDIRVLKQEI